MKSHQLNGATAVAAAVLAGAAASGTAAEFDSASRNPLPGEAERLSGTKVAVDEGKNDPAVTPPQDNPAVPRDEHHGKGGMYALVDGVRVPADDDGKPLPVKSKK